MIMPKWTGSTPKFAITGSRMGVAIRISVAGRYLFLAEKGQSFVDQSSITGESLPLEKVEGSNVFAGTINKDGVLEVRVEKIGRDTMFGKIIEIVEQAQKVGQAQANPDAESDPNASGSDAANLAAAIANGQNAKKN